MTSDKVEDGDQLSFKNLFIFLQTTTEFCTVLAENCHSNSCVSCSVLLLSDVKKVVDQDLGPHNEFYHLMDECFDFTDREYTYTLCPFDRAAQKSKHGGSETSLGSVSAAAAPRAAVRTPFSSAGGGGAHVAQGPHVTYGKIFF